MEKNGSRVLLGCGYVLAAGIAAYGWFVFTTEQAYEDKSPEKVFSRYEDVESYEDADCKITVQDSATSADEKDILVQLKLPDGISNGQQYIIAHDASAAGRDYTMRKAVWTKEGR